MVQGTGPTELELISAEISEEIAGICGHLNVLHARLVALTERALVTGAWGGHGIRSPEHWLAWQTGLSPARARRIVLLATRRHELPATIAALDAGELAIDQAVAVATYVRTHNDAEACALAKGATVSQLANLLSRYRYAPTPPAPTPPAPAEDTPGAPAPETAPVHETASRETEPACGAEPEPAPAAPTDAPTFAHGIAAPTDHDRTARAAAPGQVHFGYDDDGRFRLHADLPADVGARLDAALREAKDRLFRASKTDISWSEALLDIAERSLAATSPPRQHRYRTYVHLDAEGAWIQAGPALPRPLLDKLLCDPELQPVWSRGGFPVNIGRATKAIPDHTRRLVLDRDRVCRHPGCTCRIGLDVHHIVPWTSGGRTDLANLVALCANHHARNHRGEFTLTGNAQLADGLTFRRVNGSMIEAHRPPVVPAGTPPPAPPPGHAYAHPTGERLDTACVIFSEPPTPSAVPPSAVRPSEAPPGVERVVVADRAGPGHADRRDHEKHPDHTDHPDTTARVAA